MFRIAICQLPNSIEKIKNTLNGSLSPNAHLYSLEIFQSIDDVIASEQLYHLCLLNSSLLDIETNKLFLHIKNKKEFNDKNIYHIFIADDPISDENCTRLLDEICHRLNLDSMYLSLGFMTEGGLKNLSLSGIVSFEVCNKKLYITTLHSQYCSVDSLKKVFSLVEPYHFACPHKSFIVNLRHISSIAGYSVLMNNGKTIPISQKKSRTFRETFSAYLTRTAICLTKKPRQSKKSHHSKKT
ncbi:hypothetical protein FACS1894111_05340 [Clostridia bacterium]|nr:hypothetical protein FACS1894111_05340 [Clostridia bacterium]